MAMLSFSQRNKYVKGDSILKIILIGLLILSTSIFGKTTTSTITKGFTKQCDQYLIKVAKSIETKKYVSAYIYSKLALEKCVAYNKDEIKALEVVKTVRNKLMEEY